MKTLLFTFSFLLSLNSFASMEHKSGDGAPPTPAQEKLARKCFSEAITSGCRDPEWDRRDFHACVREQLGSFSSDCKSFIKKLYGG